MFINYQNQITVNSSQCQALFNQEKARNYSHREDTDQSILKGRPPGIFAMAMPQKVR